MIPSRYVREKELASGGIATYRVMDQIRRSKFLLHEFSKPGDAAGTAILQRLRLLKSRTGGRSLVIEVDSEYAITVDEPGFETLEIWLDQKLGAGHPSATQAIRNPEPSPQPPADPRGEVADIFHGPASATEMLAKRKDGAADAKPVYVPAGPSPFTEIIRPKRPDPPPAATPVPSPAAAPNMVPLHEFEAVKRECGLWRTIAAIASAVTAVLILVLAGALLLAVSKGR